MQENYRYGQQDALDECDSRNSGLAYERDAAAQLAAERDRTDLAEARIVALRTQLAEAQDEICWLQEQENGRLWRRLGRYFTRTSARGEPAK